MRKGTGVFTVVGLTMIIALGATSLPGLLGEVEAFHVKRVVLAGERYLTEEEVRDLLGLGPGVSVWEDTGPLADRVRRHPLVLDARIQRRLPSTLRVHVEERRPVALLPTPTFVPVDAEGRILPVDPAAHRMDLPLLDLDPDVALGAGPESATSPEVRILAREAARLASADPGLAASVSEMALGGEEDVLLRLVGPRVTLRYRPPVSVRKVREGLRVLADAEGRRPGAAPTAVDLRFDDQVVVRFRPMDGR